MTSVMHARTQAEEEEPRRVWLRIVLYESFQHIYTTTTTTITVVITNTTKTVLSIAFIAAVHLYQQYIVVFLILA